jgi:hypothetical protein
MEAVRELYQQVEPTPFRYLVIEDGPRIIYAGGDR